MPGVSPWAPWRMAVPSQQIQVTGLGEHRAVPAAPWFPWPCRRGTGPEAERSGGWWLLTPQHPVSPSHPGATGSGLAGGISPCILLSLAWLPPYRHGVSCVGWLGQPLHLLHPYLLVGDAHFSSFKKALILDLFTQPRVSPQHQFMAQGKRLSVTTQQGPHNILVFLRVLLVARCDRPGLGSRGSGCCSS